MENPNPVLSESQPVSPELAVSNLSTKTVAKFKNFKLPPKVKKIFIIVIILFVTLLIISIFAPFMLKKIGSVVPAPETSPSPSPTSSPEEILNPSVYADDPDVLAIEEDINKLEEELKNSNLREDKLRLPNLDWEVSFKDE